jgi:hypothetical protein
LDEGGAQTDTLEGARFVHKPVDVTELVSVIRQCCG